MRNRCARTACLLGLSLLATSCYNNPETTVRHPGEGSANFHRRPEVGPGTTAGGSTAGPQPPAREEGKTTTVEPTHSGATPAAPGAGHTAAPTPQTGHETGTPSGTQSRTGNQKGVGDRTADESTHGPAKH
jgi:hypothetical protein